MLHRTAVLILASCSLFGCSDAGSGTGSSGTEEASGPCEHATLESGLSTFRFDGARYHYRVHFPPDYDPHAPAPLIFNWHSLLFDAATAEDFTGLDEAADESAYLVVYPESPTRSWDAGVCCGLNGRRDDVAFARALVKEISRKACVDSKRIYSTGWSNGAYMSYRLACEATDLFAGIAPVAGKVGIDDCEPSRPISVIHFHGTADSLVPYDTFASSGEGLTVPETVAAWAERDGCDAEPEITYEKGSVTCETWSHCDEDVVVRLCSAEGMAHCWPGRPKCPWGPSTKDIDANREMLRFFDETSAN